MKRLHFPPPETITRFGRWAGESFHPVSERLTLWSPNHLLCRESLRASIVSVPQLPEPTFTVRTPSILAQLANSGISSHSVEQPSTPLPTRRPEAGRPAADHHGASPPSVSLIDTEDRRGLGAGRRTLGKRLSAAAQVVGFLLLLTFLVAIMIAVGVLATSVGH